MDMLTTVCLGAGGYILTYLAFCLVTLAMRIEIHGIVCDCHKCHGRPRPWVTSLWGDSRDPRRT